jgi:hypothetical protein
MTEGIVYRINIAAADVEDPAVYAAEPLIEWEKSESGKWVTANSANRPTWHVGTNYNTFGYNVYVVADLSEDAWTYFYLKYHHLLLDA